MSELASKQINDLIIPGLFIISIFLMNPYILRIRFILIRILENKYPIRIQVINISLRLLFFFNKGRIFELFFFWFFLYVYAKISVFLTAQIWVLREKDFCLQFFDDILRELNLKTNWQYDVVSILGLILLKLSSDEQPWYNFSDRFY